MKRAVVFAGPSIQGAAMASDLAMVDLRPPASAGDILDAAEQGAAVIGLIDGFFDRVPAPWHKEIMLALDAGIPVVGGSSLGALRAAELDVYGMVGVGWVYEQFASGVLNDDDEVAVAHQVDDRDYQAVSDAMVDIRWALGTALSESLIALDEHDRLVDLAKARFYAERSFAQLLADARTVGLDSAADVELWTRLRDPGLSIKRIDALAVIHAATNLVGTVAAPIEAEVPETGLVRQLRAHVGHRQAGPDATAIVQELRLDPGAYEFVWASALRTELAVREAQRVRYVPLAEQVDLVQESMTLGPELSENQRRRIASQEAAAHHVHRVVAPEVDHRLVDALHMLGIYGDVKARADRKAATVGQYGQRLTFAADTPTDGELVQWYFESVLKLSIPDDVHVWVTTMGYRSIEDFADVLLREWAFRIRDVD